MRSVPVNEPLLNGNEIKYLTECINTGWISSEGPFVTTFEDTFAQRVNRRYGIAVCNGTAALDVALAAIGIGEGDEVILPAFTIISCAIAVVRAGAVPVLVDSDPETWNMDINLIEKRITKRTKAIMAVHIYGLPVNMNPLLDLARQYGLHLIEDAAEAHGQRYLDSPCGSFGDISTFSFYPNKLVTTGEGGMVVTDDEELAQKSRGLRNLCFQPGRRFYHEELGWNYRLSNIQAALGLAQLEQLDMFIDRKKSMGQAYGRLLSDLASLQLPVEKTAYAENIFWVYGIVIKGNAAPTPQKLMELLGKNQIGTRPFFWPMHEQPVFQKMGLFYGESCPVAERLARRGFYIPSGLTLTKDDIQYVSEVLHNLLHDFDT
jgi:perosamine synthetase